MRGVTIHFVDAAQPLSVVTGEVSSILPASIDRFS